jgi:metal-responsive CopG/Arc/MetJ family transcriptional regulator
MKKELPRPKPVAVLLRLPEPLLREIDKRADAGARPRARQIRLMLSEWLDKNKSV